jgi:hypothetical protein
MSCQIAAVAWEIKRRTPTRPTQWNAPCHEDALSFAVYLTGHSFEDFVSANVHP